MSLKTFSLRLEQSEIDALNEAARLAGLKRADVARHAIRLWMRQPKPQFPLGGMSGNSPFPPSCVPPKGKKAKTKTRK